MNNRLSLGQDNFVNDDLLFHTRNFVKLNDINELELIDSLNKDSDVEPLDDNSFYKLLDELQIKDFLEQLSDDNSDSILEERKKFELEKKLFEENMKYERECLRLEREKFELERQQFEKTKKLSEEGFRTLDKELEEKVIEEKKKMYLEAKEVMNSCISFCEFLENYKIVQDVSE